MQQLTPQDALFLSVETETLPAHIGGLAFLEPTPGIEFSYERFVDTVRRRLSHCERFSWRLQEVPFGLDRPYWVRQKNFDVATQIHQVAVPAPYSHEALSELVGSLFERPLDRGQPLWEMVLIEGLPGDRYVLLWKMHHCMVDGAAGVNLGKQLFDLCPDGTAAEAQTETPRESIRPVDLGTAGERVPTASWVGQALRNSSSIPFAQSRYASQAITSFARSLATAPRPPQNRRPTGNNPIRMAPPSVFNGNVGPHRGIAWSSVSLDDIKRIKNSTSVTVNDVVLALTSGAVRGYLAERYELPEQSLIVSVPVSTRESGDETLGNKVREIGVEWSTDIEDPLDRLLMIHANATEAKRRAKNRVSLDVMGVLSEAVFPAALQMLARSTARISEYVPIPRNVVVSNVPMTPFPLYCSGARISQVVPISMLAPTQGMNITVLSYCGEMHFGLVHDPELVRDAWDLAGRIPKSLLSLQAAVDERCK